MLRYLNFIVYRFVSEQKRQAVIQQTRFRSTVFLCSEFKLGNIYSVVNLCGNFYLRDLFLRIAEKNTQKSQKLELTRKNFVPHGK